MNRLDNRFTGAAQIHGKSLWILAAALVCCAGCEKVAETPTTPAAVAVEFITTPSGIEVASLPAGSFMMGSAKGEAEEGPPHRVSVDAILMDRYEVTQEEYEKRVIGNPAKFKDPKHPIERVPWKDAALYCNGRSSAEGLEPCYNEETYECNFKANGYRLPTEAEWEYAARAGNDAEYSFGSAGRQLSDYAWFKDNSGERTHPVGTKKPNAGGLYDMYGNVAEWCEDVYDGKFYDRPSEPNPCSLTGGPDRALRGGSWSSATDRCRSASRSGEAPGSPTDSCFSRPDIGFRCVRRAPAQQASEETAAKPAETPSP